MQDKLLVELIDASYLGVENTVECWLIKLDDLNVSSPYDTQYIKREQNKRRNIQKLPELRKQIYQRILSDYLGIQEQELLIARKTNGKPYIVTDTFKNVNFNVSHSKQYMLVGIKKNQHIGLDIQVIHSYKYIKEAYKGILSPCELKEFSEIRANEQKEYLFCTWVQKEAIAKALGLGLLLDFTTFRVTYFASLGKFEYECQETVLGKCFKISLRKEPRYFYAIAVEL